MKPQPRIRKTIKWGGAALTVLLVVVWIASGWGYAIWRSQSGPSGGVGWGLLQWGRAEPLESADDAGLMVDRIASYQLHLTGFSRYSDQRRWKWCVPLWVLVAPVLTTTMIAFRLDTLARRRARMNLCVKCHYDRTGLAAGAVCPECGTGSGTA